MEDLQQAVDGVGFWWHSIDLGGGVITPGRKGDLKYMAAEHASLRLPDLRGRSVLDVGCWDGYYSFAAERSGAARVTALDHYAWEQSRLGAGGGFDVAHAALGSRVHKRHADFMTCELAGVGRHDVVLFLGVLYHLEEPLSAMRRLLEVTGELAVIETDAIVLRGRERHPLAEFHPFAERNGDPTNWWGPNVAAVVAWCRAAGFSRVSVVKGPPWTARLWRLGRYRAVVHARP